MSSPEQPPPALTLPTSHSEWELAEQLSEAQAELVESVERNRVLELELAALRNELGLRLAYNEHLETTLSRQHTDHETAIAGQRDYYETALTEQYRRSEATVAEQRDYYEAALTKEHQRSEATTAEFSRLTQTETALAELRQLLQGVLAEQHWLVSWSRSHTDQLMLQVLEETNRRRALQEHSADQKSFGSRAVRHLLDTLVHRRSPSATP